ncbi:MAG: hypothetical protein HQM09_24070 [Candidatus Riflebacteria bacterium]|nr:hypothetical protein [Candidatus Riflebacteria bacterium]
MLDEAQEVFKTCIEISPNTPEAYNKLYFSYVVTGAGRSVQAQRALAKYNLLSVNEKKGPSAITPENSQIANEDLEAIKAQNAKNLATTHNQTNLFSQSSAGSSGSQETNQSSPFPELPTPKVVGISTTQTLDVMQKMQSLQEIEAQKKVLANNYTNLDNALSRAQASNQTREAIAQNYLDAVDALDRKAQGISNGS